VRSFVEVLGEALRRARRQRGLTLHEVERLAAHRFSASSLGSYERGDRHISLERFCELAEIYGMPPDRLLSEVIDRMAPEGRREIVVDLTQLDLLTGDESRLTADLVQRVRSQRGDWGGDLITLRAGDVQALAFASKIEPRTLLERLEPALRRRGPSGADEAVGSQPGSD
jgi:transcriptional regulator with XRE-family HTH domain